MKTRAPKELVMAYWNAISGHPKPIELLEKYISDQEFIEHIRAYETSFPNYELIAEDYICENDMVVVRARVRGTHRGELMGIPATGNTIDLPFTAIYKVRENKIIKGWLYVDRMELMEQLDVHAMI